MKQYLGEQTSDQPSREETVTFFAKFYATTINIQRHYARSVGQGRHPCDITEHQARRGGGGVGVIRDDQHSASLRQVSGTRQTPV